MPELTTDPPPAPITIAGVSIPPMVVDPVFVQLVGAYDCGDMPNISGDCLGPHINEVLLIIPGTMEPDVLLCDSSVFPEPRVP